MAKRWKPGSINTRLRAVSQRSFQPFARSSAIDHHGHAAPASWLMALTQVALTGIMTLTLRLCHAPNRPELVLDSDS
jgi:hypothetical protein